MRRGFSDRYLLYRKLQNSLTPRYVLSAGKTSCKEEVVILKIFNDGGIRNLLDTCTKRVGIMFSIGEYVLNQKTGHMGRVIGYGHQILNDVYITTVKVLVDYSPALGKRGVVEEDLSSAWVKWLDS